LTGSDGEAVEPEKPPTPPPPLQEDFTVTPKAATVSYSILYISRS